LSAASTVTIQNAYYSESGYSSVDSTMVVPEFTVAAGNGVGGSATSILVHHRFRISGITVGTYATVQLLSAMTNTAAAAYNVSLMRCTVIRLPDFSSMPLASQFPIGNAQGFVGLTDIRTVSLMDGDRIVSQMSCPVQFIDEVRDKLFKRAMDSDEKIDVLRFEIGIYQKPKKEEEKKELDSPVSMVRIEEPEMVRSVHLPQSSVSSLRAILKI